MTKYSVSFLRYTSSFSSRHIGPNALEIDLMLKQIGYKSLDDLTNQIVPQNIQLNKRLDLKYISENEPSFLQTALDMANKNAVWKTYIGQGFYNCNIPYPIIRNVLENPGWYTAYTPYQCEIAQGRLETLFHFQTLVCELTGLPVSNAGLLDEASAAGEAMCMANRINGKRHFLVSAQCHPQTLGVLFTKARFLGYTIELCHELTQMESKMIENNAKGICALIVQYPDTDGYLNDRINNLISITKNKNILSICGTDLLALCAIEPPKDCDIMYGNCQRIGNPLGYGGPHAAFFATQKCHLRHMPGRIVGLSKDVHNEPAYRLMLQTREQHIKRAKATSNICTSQALLANMSALYAIYHGPHNLYDIANRVHNLTVKLKNGLSYLGHTVIYDKFFDTLKIKLNTNIIPMNALKEKAKTYKINFRYFDEFSNVDNNLIGIALDETTSETDIIQILNIFNSGNNLKTNLNNNEMHILDSKEHLIGVARKPLYLPQDVFNNYHSETEFVRFLKRMENKDLSLTHSMIPLGSCTMKLNATVELMPITWSNFANIHPYVPSEQTQGYKTIFEELSELLCSLIGMDAISYQSNSGAQGEYSGLCTILSYLDDKSTIDNLPKRRICFIPNSAHGTNFSSANLAGMAIIPLNTDKNGCINMHELDLLLEKYGSEIASLMVTYPSTHGFFDPNIKEICEKIHAKGGLVYMDGANMNAQIGLCRPGDMGADVCHLNLHKTFCIPHGGGGPGMGPILVKNFLKPYLPQVPTTLSQALPYYEKYFGGGNRKKVFEPKTLCGNQKEESLKYFGSISGSELGSALICIIPWAYIRLMGGGDGLKRATQIAILNANYAKQQLSNAYAMYCDNHQIKSDSEKKETSNNPVVRCAHEFIIDCRELYETYGVDSIDIAKRLQDYGFHAPTVSFPIPRCLMIEPTESETKGQIDNFIRAMLSIAKEIEDIRNGTYTRLNNPLKNAPHSQTLISKSDDWKFPYSRRLAFFPMESKFKYWPPVGRVDEIFGDKNPICSA